MNTFQKIESLEQALESHIANRKSVGIALRQEVAVGDCVLASFSTSPDLKSIGKGKAATATISQATALLAALGDEKAWIAAAQCQWVRTNFSELRAGLEQVLAERLAQRNAYRRHGAEALGALNVKIVMAEGDGATDQELDAINSEIVALENELLHRDNLRDDAQRKLRSFAGVSFESRGPFDSRAPAFEVWREAVEGVRTVDYSIPTNGTKQPIFEASPLSLEKSQA